MSTVPPNTACSLHQNALATLKCMCCGAYMCPTCVFALKGGLRVCPRCAMTSAVQGLGKRRKRNVVWGYAMALIATVSIAALMGGFFAPLLQGMNELMIGILFSLATFVPAAIGFGAASSACERHLPNSPAIIVAIIWNFLLLAAFLALTVIGNMS